MAKTLKKNTESSKEKTKSTKKSLTTSSQTLIKKAQKSIEDKISSKIVVKKVLITQPEPVVEKTPYHELSNKFNFELQFTPMTIVEGLTVREFRKNKINIPDYSAVVFNSKNAIDFYFQMCENIRHKMPQDTKYFCSSEVIAFYLQKYIQYRKRKVIYADSKSTLEELLMKYKATDRFLYPCSTKGIGPIPKFLAQKKFNFSEVLMFKMVPNEEFKETEFDHDMVIFFNSDSVKSYHEMVGNKVDKTKVIFGGFGSNTHNTMTSLDMDPIVIAPTEGVLSIYMAMDKFFKENEDFVSK